MYVGKVVVIPIRCDVMSSRGHSMFAAVEGGCGALQG